MLLASLDNSCIERYTISYLTYTMYYVIGLNNLDLIIYFAISKKYRVHITIKIYGIITIKH